MAQTIPSQKLLNQQSNEGLIVFLYIFCTILVLAGVGLPAYLISQIPSMMIEHNPQVLIAPIYIGLILLIFSTLCGMMAEILKRPSSENIWVENTLNTFSAIIIIIGAVLFFISLSETSGPIGGFRNLGIIGGVVLLVFHVVIGLLCAGLAAIHKKYNGLHALYAPLKPASDAKFCSHCGTKKPDVHGEYCEECGNQI